MIQVTKIPTMTPCQTKPCILSNGHQEEGGGHKPGLVVPEVLLSVSISVSVGASVCCRQGAWALGRSLGFLSRELRGAGGWLCLSRERT